MHPLASNLDSLSDNEIEEKVITLKKRYFQTNNPQVHHQISVLLEDYQLELEARRTRQRLQQQEQNGEEGLDSLIKVS